MNNLKEKLLIDAEAFKKCPPKSAQNNISSSIKKMVVNNQQNTIITVYKPLISLGFSFSILMVFILYFTQNNHSYTRNKPQDSALKVVYLPTVNVKGISQDIESKFLSTIVNEQKAIEADLEYFKNIFSLQKTRDSI